MQPLSEPNVESELSYAYLHAIASNAAASCSPGNRHEDNNGIDANLTLWGPFPGSTGYLKEVTIKVQLKATIKTPHEEAGEYSYFLAGNERYDDLRSDAVSTPRILVVLFLPSDQNQWITHSVNELILRRCAYWVSLRGAGASTNKSGVTVKLPVGQWFDSAALLQIAARIAQRDIPQYGKP